MATLSVEPNAEVTFKVRHQDEHLIVVEKRSGLPTQPGLGHERDTLLNGLFALAGPQLQNLGRARDFGLLHRLDKDTSGLLVAALTPRAYDGLRRAFEDRKVRKFYWAVCIKPPKTATGIIKLPLAESSGGGASKGGPKLSRISRSADSKPAVTAYRVLQASPLGALVEARPLTGRLHQVRVHLDAIGATILGDPFYGPRSVARTAPRLALHSHRLAFCHPITGTPIDVRSPWPSDLRRLLKRLKLDRPDLPAIAGKEPAADEPASEDDQ